MTDTPDVRAEPTDSTLANDASSAPSSPAPGTPEAAPRLEIQTSRQFTAWLAAERLSLAFTTYQGGKVFFIGLKPDGRLEVFNRTFERCMGLAASSQTLWLSSLYQLWRFENVLEPGKLYQDYDRVYVPQVAYTTGDIDVHDVAVDAAGRPVFVNTLFSCLATVSETHSFEPLWKPAFISKLAAEDRCHLNGLAMENGSPRYVTAVSRSDVADGWRDHRRDGGIVVDCEYNEIVGSGFSMPHSPRLHRGRLWLLNSGQGELGTLEPETGHFEPVAFCPGYARGLALHGDYAVIGLSGPRHNKTFEGLPLDERLKDKGSSARCGLHIVDLRTGDAVHWVRIEGLVEELYDVAILPAIRRPMAIGLKSDEIRRVLKVAPGAM